MLFLSKIFSYDTTLPIETTVGMNVSWGILYRNDVGIFDLSKNMATVTKNRRNKSQIYTFTLHTDFVKLGLNLIMVLHLTDLF